LDLGARGDRQRAEHERGVPPHDVSLGGGA
jgi:hypothetical protein